MHTIRGVTQRIKVPKEKDNKEAQGGKAVNLVNVQQARK
jgi:hypothetical protein